MRRPLSVEDWISSEKFVSPDGLWTSMMSRVASFHHKHEFFKIQNKGHDMGYRIALTVEELGEFSAAITKGKTIKLFPRIIRFTNSYNGACISSRN